MSSPHAFDVNGRKSVRSLWTEPTLSVHDNTTNADQWAVGPNRACVKRETEPVCAFVNGVERGDITRQ